MENEKDKRSDDFFDEPTVTFRSGDGTQVTFGHVRNRFRQPRQQKAQVSIKPIAGGYEVAHKPVNYDFVADIKTIPGRVYNGINKTWVVPIQMLDQAKSFVKKHFGVDIEVEESTSLVPTIQTKVFEVHYIGRCKVQSVEKELTEAATGYIAHSPKRGGWDLILPEDALKAFFNAESQVGERENYYELLGVKRNVPPEALKIAYKRFAFAWHPDRNQEEGARERFELGKKAYDVLSDDMPRRKYDAGLYFESIHKIKTEKAEMFAEGKYGYRAPYFCGMLTVEGVEYLGKFIVKRILTWSDIVNSKGETMISSWSKSEDKFITRFV